MSAISDEVKENVFRKLYAVFPDDPETLARVLYYLDQEEERYNGRGFQRAPPFWRTMINAARVSDELFATYAQRLASDTRGEADNENFMRYIRILGIIYDRHLTASDTEADVGDFQGFDAELLADIQGAQRDGTLGFSRAWVLMSPESQREVLNFARRFVDKSMVVWADDAAAMVTKFRGRVATAVVTLISIAYETYQNFQKWRRGEITGIRFFKNVVDASVSTAGGLAGGVAGALLGGAGGPMGCLVGGVAGGMAAGRFSHALSDRLTQWLFGLPKSVALENAYKYFGLSINASNHTVNSAYHRFCLRHHPDRGGDLREFHVVQQHMAVIRASRGEDFEELGVFMN